MNIYQGLVAISFALNILINLVDHGKEKHEKYNFWSALTDTFIWAMILKGGGFF